jgi:hypothetical protein
MSKDRKGERPWDRSILLLVIGTLVIGGGGVIALVYGPGALLTALPLLLLGAGLILIPWALLTAVARWRDGVERADRAALDRPPKEGEDE